jgi:hypothetical protein
MTTTAVHWSPDGGEDPRLRPSGKAQADRIGAGVVQARPGREGCLLRGRAFGVAPNASHMRVSVGGSTTLS